MSGKRFEPYLKRADEINATMPLVAYYCRLYVAEKLMIFHQQKDTTILEMLTQTVSQLEKARATLDLSNGQAEVETFVMGVFSAADDEDRGGTITNGTAMKFYVASLFIDILDVFYKQGLPDNWEEKRKYSKFKAADIRKCLKAGIAPTPGAPGENLHTSKSSDLIDQGDLMRPPRLDPPPEIHPTPAASSPSRPGYGVTPGGESPLNAAQRTSEGPQSHAASFPNVTPGVVDSEAIKTAKQLCRDAADNLEFDDVSEAVSVLQKALKLLGAR
eukprot:GEMP01058707.1.p1 GENE.GEMP01058707.1~~GEMP01058707.1.p1  ORF type:complete len:304 (+),score=48.04 GEMP01058707.1:95-913(+)